MRLRSKILFSGSALVLAVLAGGAFVAQELTTTSASTFGEEARADLQVTGGTCDVADKPTKCTVDPGANFTLHVDFQQLIEPGNIAFATQITFGSLIYNPTETTAEEIKFSPSALPVRAIGDGIVEHGTASGIFPPFPTSTSKGNILNLSFTCTSAPGSHTVELVPLDGTNPTGSTMVLSDGAGGQGPNAPISDTLTINCGAGAPADTPTPTVEGPPPTATSTTEPGAPTATATNTVPAPPTATITRTPTTAPATATRTPTTVPEKQLGDVNDDGEVNSTDALMVLQLEARRRSTLPNLDSADVNGDGLVNSIDALFILWIEAEII